MATAEQAPVVGVFHDQRAARQAVDDLVRAGFSRDEVGVLARASEKKAQPDTDDYRPGWEEGAAVGALTGAGLGALWALGMATGVIPVVGPVIAGGILGAVLYGAAGG